MEYPRFKFSVIAMQKFQKWVIPSLAPFLEIIYKTCNHASGRREFHPSAEHEVQLHVRTAEMAVPAS
jgi:hypothetical protein